MINCDVYSKNKQLIEQIGENDQKINAMKIKMQGEQRSESRVDPPKEPSVHSSQASPKLKRAPNESVKLQGQIQKRSQTNQ